MPDSYILKSSDALETKGFFFEREMTSYIQVKRGENKREKQKRKERQDKTIVVGRLISNAKYHGSNVCRNDLLYGVLLSSSFSVHNSY